MVEVSRARRSNPLPTKILSFRTQSETPLSSKDVGFARTVLGWSDHNVVSRVWSLVLLPPGRCRVTAPVRPAGPTSRLSLRSLLSAYAGGETRAAPGLTEKDGTEEGSIKFTAEGGRGSFGRELQSMRGRCLDSCKTVKRPELCNRKIISRPKLNNYKIHKNTSVPFS